ncbi:protein MICRORCHIDIA 7 [Prunus avium]|uniref:Protein MICRORCHIDIA 7 n=1 Tax=Prunus avium TaxID=42229 RepID=A0A6P5SI43_PRUAV|nr:protein MICRORCHIDIA 7 [Prunus avium]
MAAATVSVKQEITEKTKQIPNPSPIYLSSDSSSASSVNSSDVEDLDSSSLLGSVASKLKKNRDLAGGEGAPATKKLKHNGNAGFTFPLGFLRPLTPLEISKAVPLAQVSAENVAKSVGVNSNNNNDNQVGPVLRSCKQFWKAGDYEGGSEGIANSGFSSVGMDHVRVHPKFLHSNATSHKWALGAFAELLDNALDEICYGASYVHIDMLRNKKDGSEMLVVEDNGGGMAPDKMRQCMSLGYSAKSKMANTIGQYGNGFKTSTMRLGADVIVFSRCPGIDGGSPTQTIGMLSYSFLRDTGKEDIVVPMVDYEKRGQGWNRMVRGSLDDWERNLATIVQWSPYLSEEVLLQQFILFKEHGTRIVIYNLWEDDEGQLELDFDTDPHDIQIRGVNRDEKKIHMAKQYPNSRHFLTYRHSLRSYASILYLKLPYNFRIILRGKDVEHHNIVNDMMLTKEVTYRPLHLPEGIPKDVNMIANVTLGFVKDARFHIDVQGFNVYHKNRLIKPFWRVWNAAGSDGRGVIGVLEANFVEPAHDKQGFERTIVLSRLEARLVAMQKDFWSKNCQIVGYAPRRRSSDFSEREPLASNQEKSSGTKQNCHGSSTGAVMKKSSKKLEKGSSPMDASSEDEASYASIEPQQDPASDARGHQMLRHSHSKTPATKGAEQVSTDGNVDCSTKSKKDSHEAIERLKETGSPTMLKLLKDLSSEKARCKSLENELQQEKQKTEEMEKEQSALIEILVAEKAEREKEEERLRKSLTDASNTIDQLLEKVRKIEGRKLLKCKVESE